MKFNLIYDVPLRVFHWMFVFLFVAAFTITQVIDEDSPVFAYHMIAGILLGASVVLRFVWGFIGTRHSRFSNFVWNPKELLGYLRGVARGGVTRGGAMRGEVKLWAGHNPASSWAGFGMLALGLGLSATGLVMTGGMDKFLVVDIHEIMAFGFLGLALAHVAGIVLHTVMHKDWIGLSMVHGKKRADVSESVGSPKTAVGLGFLVFMLALASYLVAGFDETKGELTMFGKSFQLLELEGEGDVDD